MKLKAAGIISLAYGANAQQEGWLFIALLDAMAGRDGYMASTIKHDAEAAASDGVLKISK